MNVLPLVRHLPAQIVRPVIKSLETWFKARTKPGSDKLVIGTALDLMTRSKSELVAENALLRQQLIPLKRQTKRPQGLAGAISIADFDNGLLPRFALLTPEEDYHERPTFQQALDPPATLVSGLQALHEALPMPERSESGWGAAESLAMPVEIWEACQAYSNHLRRMCDPRQSTPLDDRLKGIYGRLHVQAMKVAMICSALDWLEKGEDEMPTVTDTHWQTGQSIAEHWRLSAQRLLDQLDRSGSARLEFRTQDKVLNAVRGAGAEGITLHTVYKNHNLQAAVARQIAKDLVQAGQIVETRIGRSEAYVSAEFVGD